MDKRLKQTSRVESVPLDKMRVREAIAQRTGPVRPGHVARLLRNFSIDKIGYPVINHTGGWYWIIDGQHRVAAIKIWLGEWEGQQIECRVYKNLSEQEEAEMFLDLNVMLAVRQIDKFRAALTARREDEINIEAIVRKNGLKISEDSSDGSIACVATLLKVYRRGAECLNRDLHIVNESFGDSGLDADVLDGIGLLVSRYNGQLDDGKAIRALSSIRGGVNALRSRAERLRQQTGSQKAHCMAAAAVEIINKGRGGKKLPGWWKDEGSA